MNESPSRITLDEWDARYARLRAGGLRESFYGGPLRRHADDGDERLLRLKFDNSAAALRLWNLLLSEEQRLREAAAAGKRLVGTMKDLGTVPVMAFALPNLIAFYPDGAWWIPCVMEGNSRVLALADAEGIDESFCPVRAMLGAFLCGEHFPLPELLVCSVGATCDDMSAIAQRLEHLGHAVLWWEVPHRRGPEEGEPAVELPGGFHAPQTLVEFVAAELERVRRGIEAYAGETLTEERLAASIGRANAVRGRLQELRRLAYAAPICPLPALEMQIAEMLAIHFCSDPAETTAVLDDLLAEVRRRTRQGRGVLAADAVRVYWVNPVADLRAMNLLEDLGGRVCGAEYLISHAIDSIPEDLPPMEALARMALADPMVGSPLDRAARICNEMAAVGAEALVVSRIPGASHCGWEATIIGRQARERLGVPIVEIEVPPISDALTPALRTRLEAVLESARQRRSANLGRRRAAALDEAALR